MLGWQVVAVEVGEGKLEFCRSLGADVAIDATDPQAVRKVSFLLEANPFTRIGYAILE